MLYCSTRGLVKNVSFEETLTKGYAPDGGMFLPQEIPKISLTQLENWAKYTYEEIVFEIAKLYINASEIPHAELFEIIRNAYMKFPSSERIKIANLNDGLKIAELYHGPTWAFKDLPMVCVTEMMNYFLTKRQKHATVIVATSGDTGYSAIESMKGLKSIDLIVLYPKGRCTEVQELQMITVLDENIHCYAVEGTSDDEDKVMIDILCDTQFSKQHNLSVANSMNWARIMIQIAHCVYIYLNSEVQKIGDKLRLIIPTGGAGNITAACLANMMGIPLYLIATVNQNDVLHRCIQEGLLYIGQEVKKTLASAMDIQVPYNFERIFYLYSGCDGQATDQFMKTLHSEKKCAIPKDTFCKIRDVIVSSLASDDSVILRTITKCWNENKYVLCPHTATAVAYIYSLKNCSESNVSHICIATASPLKFPNAIKAAGLELESNDLLMELRNKPTKYEMLLLGQNWKEILQNKICQISSKNKRVVVQN